VRTVDIRVVLWIQGWCCGSKGGAVDPRVVLWVHPNFGHSLFPVFFRPTRPYPTSPHYLPASPHYLPASPHSYPPLLTTYPPLLTTLPGALSSFTSCCEYSRGSEVSRGRSNFFHGRVPFMLYTERAHFFHRYKVR
jgi:hypothetical protein